MKESFFSFKTSSLDPDIRAQVADLWHNAFGDSKEYIESALSSFLSDAFCFYATYNGRVCSMFFLLELPCRYEGSVCRSYYLYAAATEKKMRNKHFFTRLFDYAKVILRENFSAEFIFLKPASRALFDFYKKLSFESTSFYRACNINAENTGYNFTVQKNPDDRLYEVYKKAVASYEYAIIKSKDIFFASLLDILSGGFSLAVFDGGFAVYRDRIIYDICASNKADRESVCKSLAAFMGNSSVKANIFDSNGSPMYMALALGEKRVKNTLCSLLFE